MTARRLIVLLVASALLGAGLAPAASALASGGPGETATAAKAKKCKKAKKGAKKGKKCKRKRSGAGPGGAPGGLPGKPLEKEPPVDPVVVALSLAPATVLGGTASSGEVTLAQPAEPGGQEVELQSAQPSRALVPAAIEVAAGETNAGFPISTTGGPTLTVPITASIGGSDVSSNLRVVEDPSLMRLALARQCYPSVGLVSFGANRVTLDVPVASDTAIALESSDSLSLSVPPSVTVPEGSDNATFGIATLLASPSVSVTATLDGNSQTDSASVRDSSSAPPALASVSVSPATIQPGAGSTGTVTLDCEAGEGGATVALASGSPEVDVPSSVLVPEDALSATFPITTTTAAEGNVPITGTLGASEQALLTIEQLGT
ncbi:MAG: hypothetical protein ACXWZK_03195 [Solirubrobacterales bacterium]